MIVIRKKTKKRENTLTNGNGGRIRFLPSEYGSFRNDIVDFFSEEVLPSCKIVVDPMAGNCPLIPIIEKGGGTAYFNDIMPFYYYLNKAKIYKVFSAFSKAEKEDKRFFYHQVLYCLSKLKNKRLILSKNWIHEKILDDLIEAWNRADSYNGPIRDFLRAVIVLCIRPFSCCTKSKTHGPWLKIGGMSTGMPLSLVVKEALKTFATYYNLHYNAGDVNGKGRCYFTRKDAASLLLKTKADVVFTSPPYCNRYEPEVTYGPELFFFRSIGECVGPANILGTTRVKDYTDTASDLDFIRQVAPKTLKFLRWVHKAGICHESDYYLRYYTRYYASLYRTLKNVLELVKRNGRVYIGIQDNIHRGELNKVGVYVSDFLRKEGMDVRVRFKRLRGHQGLRNISKNYPIVIRKHWEYIIEGRR